MRVFGTDIVNEACRSCGVADISHLTIGESFSVAGWLERQTGIPLVRMDQGSPGFDANRAGIEAEKEALDRGVAIYPPTDGVPALKEAASRFVKAFINIELQPRSCIPTTGSVAASFVSFAAACHRIPGKDKVLFIDPGFPIQKAQLAVLGIPWRSFDIYSCRGAAKMRERLLELTRESDIAAIIYSDPNNPAWICLEEEELQVIGEIATERDIIVLEDLAYFCMDYRKDLGHPWQPPFVPTVARYTDNYILMLSASKIFSYAGQRIGLACVSDVLWDKVWPGLAQRYGGTGAFGFTLIDSILEVITCGSTVSTQYAYARMLDLSCEGAIDFVSDTREYSRRAARAKEIFLRNGFYIVYDRDVTDAVGDGFFFSLSYPGMTSGELVAELMGYGVSCIGLQSTGSEQEGVRVCVSVLTEGMYPLLEERMAAFAADHPLRAESH